MVVKNLQSISDVEQYMASRNWSDMNRVMGENIRNEVNIVPKVKCGDFIIQLGDDLVYTRINGNDATINQIIHVDVDEKSPIEDTYHQIVFGCFRKDYENGNYGETSLEEFVDAYERIAEKVIGRKVSVSVYHRPGYRSNRKTGLGTKEKSRRRTHYYFGDEQDRRGDSSKNRRNVQQFYRW